MVKNIMIVGVGGQGTLLSSRIIGDVLLSLGHDVKLSEVHGMSQRGGSVVTYVRYGQNVASPIVELGQADVILAFEQLEALRYLSYASKNCVMIINDQKINPMPVIAGTAEYPEGIIEEIRGAGVNTIVANAHEIALSLGNVKAANVVLLGVFAKQSDIDKERYLESIHKLVPQKFLELNLKAFEAGWAL